jgi:hypothetical protein
MKKNKELILIIALIVGIVGIAFTMPKKKKGSIIVEPLDPGEYLQDDYNVPDYQD